MFLKFKSKIVSGESLIEIENLKKSFNLNFKLRNLDWMEMNKKIQPLSNSSSEIPSTIQYQKQRPTWRAEKKFNLSLIWKDPDRNKYFPSWVGSGQIFLPNSARFSKNFNSQLDFWTKLKQTSPMQDSGHYWNLNINYWIQIKCVNNTIIIVNIPISHGNKTRNLCSQMKRN